ncbi:hypothetical protein AEAC466_05335 [Asticcacaulis sp. AC466]|nr:hypothetical protein AEAC466_05335 [Asticcacaulis sp. AC466]
MPKFCAAITICIMALSVPADAQPGRMPLNVTDSDVVPTGNEWIALPEIKADDGGIGSFNVLSMRYRGLLQVSDPTSGSVVRPTLAIDGKAIPIQQLHWSVIAYWIPVARMTVDGVEFELTYCAPKDTRAAFIHMRARNAGAKPVDVQLGADIGWGAFERVTYQPVALTGRRTMQPAPWVDDAEVFSYLTDDTQFSWAALHPQMKPAASTHRSVSVRSSVTTVAPGQAFERDIILAPGLEEFSAPHNAKALRERIDRAGAEAVIAETANWLESKARQTGRADLDLLMNRNAFFTRFYAWGRTIDTETLVGVTSRSPRYYVSAAYWDRDAMLWSFPALLRFDPAMARQALEYALTVQLKNTGTHSRFIDGTVLEDGFQLDEAAAPLNALADYVATTGDMAFLRAHRTELKNLAAALLSHRDENGLFNSWQDSQDEYRRQAYLTYDNVLTWKVLTQLSALYARLGERSEAARWRKSADGLRLAIMQRLVVEKEGSRMFVAGSDGKTDTLMEDIPPGSLVKIAALGFVSTSDPTFQATMRWLHSPAYKFSFSDKTYGLPGSYRLPFTTSWALADHLRLPAENAKALKILLSTSWDGGIITEGVDPETGQMDRAGRAFATAAGYVSATICDLYCLPTK